MRNQIPTISLAKPPALVPALAPTAAEAAGQVLDVHGMHERSVDVSRVDVSRVDARLCADARSSQWRGAPVYAAAAGSLVFAGTGVGAFGKTGATAAYSVETNAAEQPVRTEGSTTGSTNPQHQNKLRLMSRRDSRTWRPPS
ncbi:MAG TPA: hypothetical protein VGM10_17405 [Actinocrinis sp.]|jgi:hypothetical protein